MRAAPSSPLFPRSYTAPRLRQDISNSPAHAVVLDGAPHAIVSEGAVLQGDTATVGEQVRVQLPQPLRAAVDVRPTARLTGVAVGFEGLHDAFQVTLRQSPLVVADDPLGVKLWIGGEAAAGARRARQ